MPPHALSGTHLPGPELLSTVGCAGAVGRWFVADVVLVVVVSVVAVPDVCAPGSGVVPLLAFASLEAAVGPSGGGIELPSSPHPVTVNMNTPVIT
jgi:hypothetical protein